MTNLTEEQIINFQNKCDDEGERELYTICDIARHDTDETFYDAVREFPRLMNMTMQEAREIIAKKL